MWKEILINQVQNEYIVEYLERNPVEVLVDFEDEEYENIIIKRFSVSNNDGRTVAMIECDSRLINMRQDFSSQMNNLSKDLNKNSKFFSGYFIRGMYDF